jgi:nucleotide-binding universal stress UspA family protein
LEEEAMQAQGQEPAITTILVPIDFSSGSRGALRYATFLARRFQAKVIIFHAIETLSYGMTESLQWADLYANIKTIVDPLLDNAIQDLRDSGVAATGASSQGVAYDEIVKRAEEEGADLIVMGTHGRRGLRHLLMGSVAERVVRMAPCPVLTIGDQ